MEAGTNHRKEQVSTRALSENAGAHGGQAPSDAPTPLCITSPTCALPFLLADGVWYSPPISCNKSCHPDTLLVSNRIFDRVGRSIQK